MKRTESEEIMKCINCGNIITPNAKFCKSCGEPIVGQNSIKFGNEENEITQQDIPRAEKEWENTLPPLPRWEQSPSFSNADYNLIPKKFRLGVHWTTKEIDRPELKVFKNEPFSSQKLCLKIIYCEGREDRFNRAVKECEITEMLRGTPGTVWLLDCVIDREKKIVALLEEREKTLQEYLGSERLHTITIIHIGTGILDSLIQIWKAGFLYIDIHPGNIYYDENRIKIGDFGSVIKIEEVSEYHELTGVKKFMAPEVWRDKLYSTQSVIYSVGMVLYWILNRCTPPFMPIRTEQEAFEKRMAGAPFPVPQFLQKYPEELTEIYQFIQKMTAYNPADRYESFEEARRDLALIGYDYFVKEADKTSSEVSFIVGTGDYEKTVSPGGHSIDRP